MLVDVFYSRVISPPLLFPLPRSLLFSSGMRVETWEEGGAAVARNTCVCVKPLLINKNVISPGMMDGMSE